MNEVSQVFSNRIVKLFQYSRNRYGYGPFEKSNLEEEFFDIAGDTRKSKRAVRFAIDMGFYQENGVGWLVDTETSLADIFEKTNEYMLARKENER